MVASGGAFPGLPLLPFRAGHNGTLIDTQAMQECCRSSHWWFEIVQGAWVEQLNEGQRDRHFVDKAANH